MITKDRDYRFFEIRAEAEEGIVEGYAAVFESETVLYSWDGVDYKEIIDRGAFEGAEMTDVVMNFNHEGKPVARTKNGTLKLTLDETGLRIRADLSGTEAGRQLYEEVKGGYIDKMSFAFTVEKDEYNQSEHLRRVLRVKRLYDVAAVDIPAYEATSLSARSYFAAEAERAAAEAAERERRKKKIKILTEVI